MRAFVDRKSYTDIKFDLRNSQSFTARDYDIGEAEAKAIYQHQQDAVVIQEYLEQCYNMSARDRKDGVKIPVPMCLLPSHVVNKPEAKKRAKAK